MPFIPGVGAVQNAVFKIPTAEGSRELAGQEFVDFSGGLVAASDDKGIYRWESVAPFSMATTTIPIALFENVTGMRIQRSAEEPTDHPATKVSWENFSRYYLEVNSPNRGLWPNPAVGFPTSLEWLTAASPVVNVRDLMEAEGISEQDLAEAADGWLEKFFWELGGIIYTDPRHRDFQGVLGSCLPLFAYYVYGTDSGRLGSPGEEAWYDQGGTAPVTWGKPNAHGLYGLTGGVWELIGDGREWRGGSWFGGNREGLKAAHRHPGHNPRRGLFHLGSRPAAVFRQQTAMVCGLETIVRGDR